MTTFLVLGLPVVAYVSLVLLPKGRPAAIGIAAAAIAVGLVLRLAGDGGGASGLVGLFWGGAVALAALAQGLRWAADAMGWPVSYPVIAGLVGAGALVPVLLLAGAG
jgi:hypothetical protein